MKYAIAVILALFYCGGYPSHVEAQRKVDNGTMSDSIQAVKQRHTDELMSMEGVMAVGIGLAEDGQQAIIITLQEGNNDTLKSLPNKLEGYEIVIQYSKEIRTQ